MNKISVVIIERNDIETDCFKCEGKIKFDERAVSVVRGHKILNYHDDCYHDTTFQMSNVYQWHRLLIQPLIRDVMTTGGGD